MNEIIEAATRLCNGEYGSLHLLEDNVLPALSHSGSFEHWDYDREHVHLLDRSTMVGRAAVAREVVHIRDIDADPEYAYTGPRTFRVGLGVPILFEDDLIGAMGIIRRAPEPFSEAEIELVQTFADEAAVVLKNARLLETVERQLSQQRAVGAVMRSVARSRGLQAVLDDIVESVTMLSGVQNGRLYLLEDGLLHAVANSGNPENFEYDRQHPHAIDRSTLTGRAALTRAPVHIPDILEDPEYTYAGDGSDLPYRSGITVPILLDDKLIGALGNVSEQPGAFTDAHVELLQTFADQAAIAIANARLIEAVERQLEQQRAISDVLGVVARAEGLDAVFCAAVETATRLCRGDYGALYLRKGEVLQVVTRHRGVPELYEFEYHHPHTIDRTTAVGRAALTGEVVHIPDTQADPEYAWGGSAVAEYRSLLAAPILVEGELIGAMDITRREVDPFSEEEMRIFRTFADQAAIAVANARLIDAVEQQLEQQRAISDVLGVVARSEGLDVVFEAAVENAARLCAAEYGQICIADGDVFRLAGSHGASDEVVEYERAHPMPRDRTSVVGRVAVTGDVVHIPDVFEDPDYEWGTQEILGYRAMLGIPIVLEDELIGVFSVVRSEPVPFTEEHIELVKTFAHQAAIAISNARLMEAVERQRSELSRFVSPQVAELVTSEDGQKLLAGHRAYVTSMFCDLRGFTSFTELAEPEELFEVLQEYHAALGELIPRYQGTLEHFAGDGLLVFFNDPVPVDDHELKAIELSLAAQQRFEELAVSWRKLGHELGLGVGIAAGYATLGRIGFEGRYDYGVLGTVNNLASRLSSHAEPGQTLISQRVYAAVEERVDAHEVGSLELKGFGRPVPAYEVRGLKA